MDVPPEMQQALDDGGQAVLDIEGVNGVEIGLDATGDDVAIRVLVADAASPPAELPEYVGGYPVMVIQSTPQALHTIPDHLVHAAATGGIQIGRAQPRAGVGVFTITSGCLGMIFRMASQNNEPVALSNAHVMCGTDPTVDYTGDVIQQPAPQTIPAPASERLGVVENWSMPDTPPLPTSPQQVPSGFLDAAICSVERGFTGSEVEDIGMLTDLIGVSIADPVKKRGPESGLTNGVVTAVSGSYLVHDHNGTPLWWMLGQVRIAPDVEWTPSGVFIEPGDSGSVLVRTDPDTGEEKVTGLLWGGDGSDGFATDIFAVTNAFGLVMG